MMNEILKNHFLNPQNMGVIKNPSFQTIIKSETCNDIVKMMVTMNDGLVQDIKTEVFGCGYSIAGASFFTHLAKGKKSDEIPDITDRAINEISGDIPEKHMSCINLSVKAFQKIHEQYSSGK